ncbi:hypothetical protein [Motilimonas sp. KMU-193]|uniref:hypothetical protein n=1 Tax=Motilimonas sp. KMU-193 TaxID=3388668 RepID=UPI00396B3A76
MNRLLYLLLFASISATAGDFSSPESAIKSLEAAYANQDMQKAMEARDFHAEAYLMIADVNKEYLSDPEIMLETEKVLKLGFQTEMKNGLPDFSGVECVLKDKETLKNNVVRFVEICKFPGGGQSKQYVHAYKGKNGWRFVAYAGNNP